MSEDRGKDEFRKNRALEACARHGNPSHRLKVFAVTGTNGKTTTTYLLEALLRAVGERPAVIGTVENRFEGWSEPSKLTTPGSDDLQALLADFLSRGATAVAIEVSSHALDQFRAWGTRFEGAVFTNLTQDHLDYHGDMEHYYLAKRRLFTDYDVRARAVHAAGPWGERLCTELKTSGRSVVSFGVLGCDLNYRGAQLTTDGIHGRLEGAAGRVQLNSPLVGGFNVQNLAGVAALGLGLGYDPDVIARGLNSCTGVPGRLERVGGTARGYTVLVDYAHTPDALEKALTALKPLTRGRLKVVFGCGGDRDPGKRPQMAAIAERLAHDVFVTSDNPRTEDPAAIVAQVAAGLKKPDAAVIEVDRETAIAHAIAQLSPGDVLLIAGKGHEDYQIIGTEKRHFDDREVALKYLG